MGKIIADFGPVTPVKGAGKTPDRREVQSRPISTYVSSFFFRSTDPLFLNLFSRSFKPVERFQLPWIRLSSAFNAIGADRWICRPNRRRGRMNRLPNRFLIIPGQTESLLNRNRKFLVREFLIKKQTMYYSPSDFDYLRIDR